MSLLQRLAQWLKQDDVIDTLVARNTATHIAGMETVDWQQVECIGQRRYSEVLRAQLRSQKFPASRRDDSRCA